MNKKLFQKLHTTTVRSRDEYTLEIDKSFDETVKTITNAVGESDDVIQRDFLVGKKIKAALFFVDGICDTESIEEDIIRPLLYFCDAEELVERQDPIAYIEKEVITLCEVESQTTLDDVMLPLLSGVTLLVIEGVEQFLLFETRQYNQRSIQEPESEVVVRGPRDGFIETLHTNVLLMRRRLRDPNLTVQFGVLGRRSKKDFAILYLKGVANEQLIDEVRYRVSCVDVDDVSDTGTLEQYIEDNVFSIFPQMHRTERPDKTTAALLNGQIVVFLDGSPFSLMAPVTFHQLFRSPEDYYDRWHIGTLVRLLRYFAAFIAMFLPALYIAMTSYHQGMIPTRLALSIAGSREGVPFPAFIEAVFMEITLELLREAGVRLPRPVGQTIGIVGGLVIGDAAVRAGVVSPIMVIVVALTAIASFVIPAYNFSITIRILRFLMMVSAGMFGLYGVVIAYIFINIHLVGLKSFGVYYTSPFAPYRFAEWADLVIRLPVQVLKKRFTELNPKDQVKKG